MEYRMYHLVMYNISPIQQGIQAYHAGMEYARIAFDNDNFQQWMKFDKTVIILNGGTSNQSQIEIHRGTIQKYSDELTNLDVLHSEFYEPDLNDTLSAIAFLVPEQVWNYEKYPDFETIQDDCMQELFGIHDYDEWEVMVGGHTNAALRIFLKQFKLA